MPAAIGFWELELKKGRKSQAELLLIPNPSNRSSAITLLDGEGRLITIPNQAFSQDVTVHGLINRSFCANSPCEIDETHCVPGQIAAKFFPGVIEMDGRWGNASNISDPGLKRIADNFSLQSIRRLFRGAERNPRRRLSRTGKLFTPTCKWDIYVLHFPCNLDLSAALDSILALPRCQYAAPNEEVRPVGFVLEPNDSLAGDSWHLERIGMPSAWGQQVGDEDIRIGVIDGGVDYQLDDLGAGFGSGSKIVGGYDYANDDGDPKVLYGDDLCGDQQDTCEPNHGNWTHSITGALTNNDSLGVAGIAGGWGGYEGETGPSILLNRPGIAGDSIL